MLCVVSSRLYKLSSEKLVFERQALVYKDHSQKTSQSFVLFSKIIPTMESLHDYAYCLENVWLQRHTFTY